MDEVKKRKRKRKRPLRETHEESDNRPKRKDVRKRKKSKQSIKKEKSNSKQIMERESKNKTRYKSNGKISERKKKKRKRLTKAEIEQIRKRRRRKTIVEIIKFILPVVILATLTFLFILKTSPHTVDGASMNPTLGNGERVLVRHTKNPKRYEVITFKPPVNSDFPYVKRIIGMPGDLIWTEDNNLFINHQSESLPEVTKQSAATELPDGTIKINITDNCLQQLSKLKKIPDGYYFVLGDNRNNSSDSRVFGLVSENSIEGVVFFRYSPLDKIGFIT